MSSQKECDALMKKGEKCMKGGFFSSPDYINGEVHLNGAAKGYNKLKQYEKALEAYKKCLTCQEKMNSPISQSLTLLEIANLYFFNVNNFDEGLNYLNRASNMFLLSNKFTQCTKIYIDASAKFMEQKNFADAEKILKCAYKICMDNIEERRISTSFHDVYDSLLDVQCGLKKWAEAIEYMEKYIAAQLKMLDKDYYRINKNYLKLGILRIINNEQYMVDSIITKMFENANYEGTVEDAGDLRKLNEAFTNNDQKSFTFAIQSTFCLFQNNLLKGLQEIWTKKSNEAKERDEATAKNLGDIDLPKIEIIKDDNKPKEEEEIKKDIPGPNDDLL